MTARWPMEHSAASYWALEAVASYFSIAQKKNKTNCARLLT
jgi:hypothetical protein